MVVDSSIFIQHLRAKDKTTTYLSNLPDPSALFVSSVTVFELYCGAVDANKQLDVDVLLSGIIVLPLDHAVASKAAELYRELRVKAQMIEINDMFIAATALVFHMPIKTLNTRHFLRIQGLEVI